MAEEKVAHLEPTEESSTRDALMAEHKQEGFIESPVVPESQAERKVELKNENETLYQKILSSVSGTSPQIDGDVDSDAQKIILKTDADSKVSQLVDLATTKGVAYAVKVARHLDDFYVLDQLHDDLANKLYESLKEKGLISE